MKVVFLGTNGNCPTRRRQTTCIMIPEYGVVLDAGTGFLDVRHYLRPEMEGEVNVLLSHAHFDHCCGLQSFWAVFPDKTAQERVTIWGYGRHLQAIRHHLFSPDIFPISPAFRWASIDGGERAMSRSFKIFGATVRWQFASHWGVSIGYRLTFNNKKVVVCMMDRLALQDRGTRGEQIELASGADLLIHECNFPDSQRGFARQCSHSYASAVNRLASRAGVRRLAVTHFSPLDDGWTDPSEQAEACFKFPGVIVAQDGLEVEI